jgi:hypothetical protein
MREKTFLEFIRKEKIPFFFTWPLNIGYLLIVTFIFYKGETLSQAIIGVGFVTIGFITCKFFIYRIAYKPYRAGWLAIQELTGQAMQTIENVGAYCKGFDLINQKKISFDGKTIYDFEQADLILTGVSLIVMGKSSNFNATTYAYPVEIMISDSGVTSLPKAKLKKWTPKGDRIEIELEDSQYNGHIHIEIKNEDERIKQLLQRKV